MKNEGLKKSIILLSILPYKVRKKVLSHLSIFELKNLFNFAENFGGFENLKFNMNKKNEEYVLKKFFQKLEKIKDFTSLDLFIGILALLFGIVTLIVNFFNSSFQDFFYQFISLGYSAIIAPSLIIYLIIKGKFSIKFNFTNSRIFIRHIIEAIASAFLLIIILMEINALYSSIQQNKPDIFSIIYGVVFIPLFEEILFRYILIGIFLNKMNKVARIIISAFLFSIAHLSFDSLLSFFLYFLSGIILSILFSLENYILPSFLAHSIANFVIILID